MIYKYEQAVIVVRRKSNIILLLLESFNQIFKKDLVNVTETKAKGKCSLVKLSFLKFPFACPKQVDYSLTKIPHLQAYRF